MFIYDKTENMIPIRLVTENNFNEVTELLPEFVCNWLETQGFRGKPGEYCVLPDAEGFPNRVLAGHDRTQGIMWALAALPQKLPEGDYFLEGLSLDEEMLQAAVGWGLGCYRFEQFKSSGAEAMPRLLVEVKPARVSAIVDSVFLVRNMINTPANHMMPQDIEAMMQRMADMHDADLNMVTGAALLEENFPAIHAVGRASVHAPRLLELNWGDEENPLVTLVGKGVCFDSGGLDIKPSSNMRIMKKDMGGAAHVLGLANLIMRLNLPVSLQVLIPAVENAISGDAFRPGDVLATRLGKTVEVDNTDAEGRLVLCDALAYAAEFDPDVLIDFATLTGAARVALGTEVPVFFCNDRNLMQDLQIASATSGELIWNLPLHRPYFDQLKSHVADMTNSGDAYGGAITAALFLDQFVPARTPWAHFDVMAWNLRERAGRPVGGEAMGLLAVFEYIETQFLEEGEEASPSSPAMLE